MAGVQRRNFEAITTEGKRIRASAWVGPLRYNQRDPFNFLDLSAFALRARWDRAHPIRIASGGRVRKCTTSSITELFTNPELPLFYRGCRAERDQTNGTGFGFLALAATRDVCKQCLSWRRTKRDSVWFET